MSAKQIWLAVATVVGIGVAVVLWWTDSEEEKAAKVAAAEKQRAEEDARCAKDLACIGNALVVSAGVYCKRDIERQAKNSVRWTDGALEPKFSAFRWGNRDSTLVTMLGDKVQFQNGFGAFTNVVYECDFDVASKTPVAVRVREGWLD